LDQVLERACTQDRVEAVADKVAVPTSTLEAADLLHPLLAAVPAGGVVHLCNAGECTWQQYGQFALDCAERAGVGLRARVVEPVPMSAMKAFVARRPVYSAMATGKLTRLIGRAPRPWQEAVEEYVRGYWRRA
jgi:dTDP-4-dehydrorhamnose reductase